MLRLKRIIHRIKKQEDRTIFNKVLPSGSEGTLGVDRVPTRDERYGQIGRYAQPNITQGVTARRDGQLTLIKEGLGGENEDS